MRSFKVAAACAPARMRCNLIAESLNRRAEMLLRLFGIDGPANFGTCHGTVFHGSACAKK